MPCDGTSNAGSSPSAAVDAASSLSSSTRSATATSPDASNSAMTAPTARNTSRASAASLSSASVEGGEDIDEVGGKGRREAHALARAGMVERELLGVQEGPGQAERGAGAAIAVVAHHR